MPPRKRWWGTRLQGSITEMLGSCARGNHRLRCYFGFRERNLFLMQFPEQVFGLLLQTVVKQTELWSKIGPWEYFVENLYGEQKDVYDWKKPSMNEVGRRKERDLYFLRTGIRDTKWAVEMRTVQQQDLDLSRPLNLMQRGIRLRQRKTCSLRPTPELGTTQVELHFDLLSEGVSSPASTVQERRIVLELSHVDPILCDRHVPLALSYYFQLVMNTLGGGESIPSPLSNRSAAPVYVGEFRPSGDTAEVVKECVPLMNEFRLGGSEGLEMEGRIGHLFPQLEPQPHYQFVPGVSRDHFFLLVQKMGELQAETKKEEEKSEEWHDSIDLFWDQNLRGTKTRETTMTGKNAMQLVTKSSRCAINVRSADRPYAFRVSLKTESKVRNDSILRPRATWYRFKRRRSFLILDGRFRFDFTIVGEGATEELAIRGPKVFEIELEAMPPQAGTLLPLNEEDTAMMIHKLSQLLDPDDFVKGNVSGTPTLTIAHDALAFLDCEKA